MSSTDEGPQQFRVEVHADELPAPSYHLLLNTALQKALDEISDHGWKPGTYEDVRVEFFAKVEVTNPGRILSLQTQLSPGG
jgi:hypothetical protein